MPHFSTFGKNYVRRFRETTLFEDIFAYILEQSVKAGFVTEDNLYMDSTHIKANANKHKFTKELTHVEAKAYQKELENEINEERIKAGKNTFTWGIESELKEKKISKIDPESGYYVKGEREKQFAYSAHTACDDNGFILDVIITPGNVHDSQVAIPLLNKVLAKFPKISTFVADAGYKTPYICKSIIERQLRPVLPYTRPRGDKELFRKNDFVYDEYYESYICPNGQMIHFSTVNRDGYREYKSKKYQCEACPLLTQCIRSKSHQKVLTRQVWQDYVDIAEDLWYTDTNKAIYKHRKETIERIFADAKEKHGFRRTKYRSLEKATVRTILMFAAINLKKLTTWLTKGDPVFTFLFNVYFKQKKIEMTNQIMVEHFDLSTV